jgi:hypothetical protein
MKTHNPGGVNPYHPDSLKSNDSVLAAAERAVRGPRHTTYGSPAENHKRTAELFSSYLGVTVTARQVCMLNILQKVSRDAHTDERDNLVDIAGYAENADRV